MIDAGERPQTLERLLAPVTVTKFFQRYWELEPLVIHRRTPSYFETLLTLEELDCFLTTPGLKHPEVTVLNAAARLTPDDYTTGEEEIDPVAIARLFAEGATITIGKMQRRSEVLATFCQILETELSSAVHANVYLTPARAQGFRRHYDTHDVFILQLLGSKRWSLYQTPIELPLADQIFDSSMDEGGDATMQFTLEPGDTAYVPRGVIHDAASGVAMSMHVTIGVRPYRWSDVLTASLTSAVLEDAGFRRALPAGFARMDFDRAEARRTFQELLQRFASAADVDAALDAFVEEFVTTRQARMPGPMSLLASLDRLNVETIVVLRPGLVFDVHDGEDHILLRCRGRELELPLHAGDCLRFALSGRSFAVGELPGSLVAAEKIDLVGRLLQEGVLAIGGPSHGGPPARGL